MSWRHVHVLTVSGCPSLRLTEDHRKGPGLRISRVSVKAMTVILERQDAD